MNTRIKTLPLLGAVALFSLSTLTAVETVPVGYITKDVNANADLKAGVPFEQASSFAGAVSSVTAGVVSVTSTVPDVTTDAHYLLVTSGPLLGKWYEVTANGASTVSVAEDLETVGLVAGNTFKVIPFWTLDTLFPSGGGIPASDDVFSPVAFVLTNNLSAVGINISAGGVYFYHDGTQGPAGWYDNDDLGGGLQGSTVLSPETFITIRNGTGSIANVTMSGVVPEYSVSVNILSRSAGPQDNQIQNPFPAGLTLADSQLFEDGVVRGSSDVFSPLDLLLIFEGTPAGLNPSSSKVVFYHDGTQGPAGWYDNDDLGAGVINNYELPLGGALIVRRATGSDELISWTPNLPYALN